MRHSEPCLAHSTCSTNHSCAVVIVCLEPEGSFTRKQCLAQEGMVTTGSVDVTTGLAKFSLEQEEEQKGERQKLLTAGDWPMPTLCSLCSIAPPPEAFLGHVA